MLRRTFLSTLPAVGAAFAVPAVAAPSSRLLDPVWAVFGTAGDPNTSAWADFLQRHLDTSAPDGITRVRYSAALGDRVLIRQFLTIAEATDPRDLSRSAAMAFWINLYNALTIDLVLEAWPIDSIKEVRGGFFNLGPWDEKAITILGRDLTLDDIEHGILRPIWRDPRVHYGVNCASLGCPNLAARPYHAATLDEDLNRQAETYITHDRGVRLTKAGLVLSSIYDWFAEDFGDTEESVLNHIQPYLPNDRRHIADGTIAIAGYGYDWTINAA